LESDGKQIARWLSEYLGYEIGLVENRDGGFPDDMQASGPTIVSSATYAAVAEWFPDLTLEEIRRRFRANLEVERVEAFWEDRLYSETGPLPFAIGSANFLGHNSSQRCVVVTRDSRTGEVAKTFAKRFMQQR